jgi:heme/copper-type cytochrome/quinol oxidase subunit 2
MEVTTTSTTDPVNMYNYLNSYILNPIVFIIVLLIIVAFYVFSSSLGGENSGLGNNGNTFSNIMGIIIITILIILILANAFQYFFSINVTTYIHGLFSPKTNVDIVVDESSYKPLPAPVPEIKFKKQVFNIPGNYYDFENAKALCQAYDADLASYDQIEKAYNNGAEWCNYGWSANQLALFPTQKQTYDNLQKIPGHEHDCGRAGINGGYIANPKVKFGVNCYGYKPKITEEEEDLMKTATPYPETAKDIAFQKRVDYWRKKVDEILVSPFNYDTWGNF